jgi:hypothetical protein
MRCARLSLRERNSPESPISLFCLIAAGNFTNVVPRYLDHEPGAHVQALPGNKARVVRAQEGYHIGDVFGSTQPS